MSTDVDALCSGWRKASRSLNNGACVEVASACAAVLVRDSVNPSGVMLSYDPGTWQAFIEGAKSGVLDSVR